VAATDEGRAAGSAPGGPRAERRAYIGLGANLGDVLVTLEAACEALRRLPNSRWIGRSGWYRSAPVDAYGPDFLNAVAVLDTRLEPLALLRELQAIERAQGRERPYINAPRTLDLDLLLCGEVVCDTPVLTLPHPRLQERAFVLLPLEEVAPNLTLPGLPTMSELKAVCANQRIERLS
jgi:2-amino-4-hydroxy-6-hydroxymethyldihydropteridine diphosphokinase